MMRICCLYSSLLVVAICSFSISNSVAEEAVQLPFVPSSPEEAMEMAQEAKDSFQNAMPAVVPSLDKVPLVPSEVVEASKKLKEMPAQMAEELLTKAKDGMPKGVKLPTFPDKMPSLPKFSVEGMMESMPSMDSFEELTPDYTEQMAAMKETAGKYADQMTDRMSAKMKAANEMMPKFEVPKVPSGMGTFDMPTFNHKAPLEAFENMPDTFGSFMPKDMPNPLKSFPKVSVDFEAGPLGGSLHKAMDYVNSMDDFVDVRVPDSLANFMPSNLGSNLSDGMKQFGKAFETRRLQYASQYDGDNEYEGNPMEEVVMQSMMERARAVRMLEREGRFARDKKARDVKVGKDRKLQNVAAQIPFFEDNSQFAAPKPFRSPDLQNLGSLNQNQFSSMFNMECPYGFGENGCNPNPMKQIKKAMSELGDKFERDPSNPHDMRNVPLWEIPPGRLPQMDNNLPFELFQSNLNLPTFQASRNLASDKPRLGDLSRFNNGETQFADLKLGDMKLKEKVGDFGKFDMGKLGDKFGDRKLFGTDFERPKLEMPDFEGRFEEFSKFEKPEMPKFEKLKFEIPDMPKFEKPEIPKFEKPELPKFEKPELPKFEKPERPKFEKPEIPKFEKPEMPKFEKPELPKFDKPEMPKLEKPEFPKFDKPERPKLDMPKFEMPEVPNFELPEMPVFEKPDLGELKPKLGDSLKDLPKFTETQTGNIRRRGR